MAKVKPIPDGYHSVTPYLDHRRRRQGDRLLQEGLRRHREDADARPRGKVGHAELTLGDSMIMLADEHPEMGHRGPHAYGGSAVSLWSTSPTWTPP